MRHLHEHYWPAREPPADFVESTVARMLAATNAPRNARLPMRRMVWLLAAALLVSGVALGFVYARPPTTRARPMPQNAEVVVAPPKPTLTKTVSTTTQPSVSPTAKPLPKAPSARKGSSSKPKPNPVSTSDPIRRIPPCGCERGFGDYICDCY